MAAPAPQPIDWEAFYRGYRKPGYVPGFEILHKIGGGAFGLVYRARKESIGKDYAIKFLRVDDEGVRDVILRELNTVRYFAQLDHPNLVTVEDQGEVDGIPYIVMGYAGDETLRSRLELGPIPRHEALALFQQVAAGVQALHDRSIAHFDLKPSNVFLKGDLARVGDYGLAKLVAQTRNSLTFGRGTPYYMAPELLQRRGDHRSDIYALGVLLYECLLGDVPFHGDSEWEVLRKHEREQAVLPPSLQGPERRVIERCLRKDPTERYADVRGLLAELLPAAAPRAATPPPPPPHAIGVAPCRVPGNRRHRVRTNVCGGGAAALLTLLVLVGGAMLWSVRESRSQRAFAFEGPQHRVQVQRGSAHALGLYPRGDRPSSPRSAPRTLARGGSGWEERLEHIARSELQRLGEALARADLEPRLREALRRTAAELRRDLGRGNLNGVSRQLDRLGAVLESLLADLDRHLAPDACDQNASQNR